MMIFLQFVSALLMVIYYNCIANSFFIINLELPNTVTNYPYLDNYATMPIENVYFLDDHERLKVQQMCQSPRIQYTGCDMGAKQTHI